MRLLIVDDSRIERMILKEMLLSEGYAVEEAENGAQALEMALLSPPDMIISDILMPVMDGFRLCREIRANTNTADIPVIFYTGTYTKPEDEEFAFQMGADRFLVKSMDWEVFFRELKNVGTGKKMAQWRSQEQIPKEEKEIYKLYNERLIKKLEEKVAELESEVTWRKKLEKQLYASQESLQLALEGADLGMWDWNVQTGEAKFNQEWAQNFGYSAEELLPSVSTWEELIHPDDREKTLAGLQANVNGLSEFYESEHRLKDKSGKWHWFLARGKVVSRDKDGNALRHVGTFLNISDRIEARIALENEKEKYRVIFDSAPAGIYHYDANSVITDCNAASYHIFGTTYETAVGFNQLGNIKNEEMIRAIKKSLAGSPGYFYGPYTSVLSGKTSFIKAGFVPVFSPSKKVSGGICVVEDISVQVKASEAVAKSEKKYRSILENIEDGYFEVDLAGNLIFFNKALSDILGYPEAELKGKNYRSFMDAENAEKTFKTFNKVFETGQPLKGFDWKIVRKSGLGGYLDTSVSPIKNADGSVVGFRGVTRDVSDRRLMEKFLAESEERYRLIFDSAPVGIFHYDVKGVIRACNQAFADIGGSSFGKLIGFDLLNNAGHTEVRNAIKQTLAAGPGHFEGEYTSVTGGRTSYIKADFVPVYSDSDVLVGGMCVVEDLTDKVKVELALKKSEQEAAVLLNATTDAAALLDPDGTIININDAFARRFHKQKEAMQGKCVWTFFPETVAEIRKKIFYQVFETGKPVSFVDKRDGFWNYSKIFPVIDASGKVARVAVFAQDITDKKRAEEALKASEEKYRALADHSPGIILLSDPEGICRFVSPSVERILGFTPDEMIGTVPGDYVEKEYGDKVYAAIARAMNDEPVKSFEIFFTRKDGSSVVLEWECFPVRQGDKISSVQFLGRDITDRKAAEEEVKSSRRQLRELSKHLQLSREQERAGIAREIHDDLGQSLTAIKMDVSWLRNKIPEQEIHLGEKTDGVISLIDSAIQSVKRISSELRPGLLDDLGLSAAIEWQAGDYQKRSGININVNIDPEEICLDADRSIAIFRVCQESLTNVVRHSGATDVWVELSKTDGYVMLMVTDNGCGVSEHEIAKKNSFGLIGMRERIHAFDGKIKISRIRDGGTRVAVQVPLGDHVN